MEISGRHNTRDFCEIFLLFLTKNNGNWINKKIHLEILKEKNFHLFITGINNEEIPEKITFEIIKSPINGFLKIRDQFYNEKYDILTPQIFKENDYLVFRYYKPDKNGIFARLIRIRFSIITTNSLEMELIFDPNEYPLPILLQ